jgi:hypothetical protein
MNIAWTVEENTQLAQDYSKLHIAPAQFEEKYHRTWEAVRLHARGLGLRRQVLVETRVDLVQLKKDFLDPAIKYDDIPKKHDIGVGTFLQLLKKYDIQRCTHFTETELKQVALDLPRLTQEEIQKKYNIAERALQFTVRQYNKNLKYPAGTLIFKEYPLPYTIDEIKCMYEKDKLDSSAIAERCGICDSKFIRKALKKAGCRVRTLHEANLTYELDEHYFDTIDTQNKAYLLGFFAGDGCNQADINRLCVSIQEGDRAVLEFYLKELKCTAKLKYKILPGVQNQVALILFSAHMCKTLSKHGSVPCKSLIMRFPSELPDEYVPGFLLGNLDADGCAFYRNNGYCHRIDFISTKEFLRVVQDKLTRLAGIGPARLECLSKTGKDNYRLSVVDREDQEKLFYWLYGKTDFWLGRKYIKFEAIVEHGKLIEERKQNRAAKKLERRRFKIASDYEI